MLRKQVLMDTGLFEGGSIEKPAFHLWLRMAKAGARIGYQKKTLVRSRILPDKDLEDTLARAEGERSVLERVRDTVELSAEESQVIHKRIAELDMQLALEQGRTFLKSGDYTGALSAFRVANGLQPSLKLKAITWLTRLAPKTALKFATPPNKTNTHWASR